MSTVSRIMELELSLPRSSSVTISSTIFDKELDYIGPLRFHQNWNEFQNLELLVPLQTPPIAQQIHQAALLWLHALASLRIKRRIKKSVAYAKE